MMILNDSNYFSPEASWDYMGVSQYKDFAGTIGKRGCEAAAMAKLRGEWQQEKSTALLVGSFVDSHFEGTLDVFRAQNPEIFTKQNSLKAEYRRAEEVIQRIERDPYFMHVMSGEKQRIMTGELFGIKWKIKIDVLHDNAIVDLKVMKSLTESFYVKDLGRVNFIEAWGYDVQAAVYQEIVRQNTGKLLPFYIAAASKEEYPDLEVIGFDQQKLDDVLGIVGQNIERVKAVKSGQAEPDRCGECNYCRHTKVLSKPIHYSELIQNV